MVVVVVVVVVVAGRARQVVWAGGDAGIEKGALDKRDRREGELVVDPAGCWGGRLNAGRLFGGV